MTLLQNNLCTRTHVTFLFAGCTRSDSPSETLFSSLASSLQGQSLCLIQTPVFKEELQTTGLCVTETVSSSTLTLLQMD